MEHQPSSQQVITKDLTLEDESEKIKVQIERKKLANSYFLRHLIQRHPKLVLLGVSAFILFAIYSSIVSIFQIGVLQENTEPIPIASTNNSNYPPAPTDNDNSLPLWLLGAITISSAAAGVAIAKRLSNSSSELSQFFLKIKSSHQPQQQFPPLRESILSLSALKLSEPKPTWAESSMETELQSNIDSEDEFVIAVEEDFLEDGEANFLEVVELTPEEKNLIFENIAFAETLEPSPQMRSLIENLPSPKTAPNSASEKDVYSPHKRSLAEVLDLRQKFSLATLLETDK